MRKDKDAEEEEELFIFSFSVYRHPYFNNRALLQLHGICDLCLNAFFLDGTHLAQNTQFYTIKSQTLGQSCQTIGSCKVKSHNIIPTQQPLPFCLVTLFLANIIQQHQNQNGWATWYFACWTPPTFHQNRGSFISD